MCTPSGLPRGGKSGYDIRMPFRPSKELCACGNKKSQVAKICIQCSRKRIDATCAECGSAFTHAPSRPRLACGPKCADRLRAKASSDKQSRKVALVCQNCGTSKFVSPAYAGRRFCSTRCAYDGMSGPNHAKWKGGCDRGFYVSRQWTRVCRAVRKRDCGKCQRCGAVEERGERLHDVHHIASATKFPELRTDPSNLVLLCRGCHRFVHSRANAERRFIRLKH